ncbi:MAG: insulinase family protein [Bacteroidales bacterium]|nr:insulinase family protein [Bacteroidales bacterium]MCM1147115.1 insulinase family protein [Bacteroidales bacterium]MCM1205751.1 insulinase family protein [Bacillota bacterium]MCM1511142.1 insulinase family protein [Clostridium sp.]
MTFRKKLSFSPSGMPASMKSAVMRSRSVKTLLLLSALIISATVSAQQLPLDSCIRKGVLDNGLTYYIRHNAQTPGQADFYIAQRVGSILEEPHQRGLAHFLEHAAFNGTKNFPAGNGEENSVRNWCEKNGIKFGADLNAYTSIDQTVYNISNAPVTKAGVTDTCLIILHDWAGFLLLKGEEIDKERGVIREEWRARRSRFASTRLMEDAMATIYAGSKYADCLPIGHIEVVDTFHHDALRDYYRKWYRPDLQGIIVVGDINVDEVEAKIKSLFGADILPEERAERIYYNVPDNKEMILFTKADDEQPSLNLQLYMKRDAEPRETRNSREAFIGGYKSRLAMFILRQRLQQLSREAEPRLMSTTCRDNSFYVTPEKDAFALTIGLLPANPKAGIDAAIEVVEKARRYGFTEAELEHAKVQHTVSIEHKLDNKDKTRNAEYARSIVNNFCNAEPCMNIVDEAALEAYLSDSITLEDINNTVKEIITNKNQVCIVFGPTKYDGKPYTMPSENEFKTWIETAQQKDYTDDNDNTAVDQTFMKKLPKKGKIVSRKQVANGYKEYVLSNGIKVYARSSDIEPNRLTINMFRLGGRSLYSDDDAATLQFLGSVVRESGAADFDYLTLEKKRRGKALRVTPYISAEEEGVNGVCVASDLKTWLEVMHLYLTQPRKDDAIFRNTIAKQRSLLKNRTANPNVSYNDSLRVALYGQRKRTEPMTEQRLGEVDHERMYQIYKERFSNLAGMNLIITGDIREDDFEDLLCQYVASLPGKPSKAQEPKVGKDVLDIQRVNATHVFAEELKTPSALTNVFYTADIPYTAENDLKLDVLSQIMRAVYTETVREEKGGTYGVSVSGQFWKYPSDACCMTINFRCAPDKYAELLPIIDEQLQKMAANGPTGEQLKKVKEYERKNYDRAVLTNGWWEYVCYHELKEGIDFEKDYLKKVDALTTDDIRLFCKQLVDAKNRIQVTMTPKN